MNVLIVKIILFSVTTEIINKSDCRKVDISVIVRGVTFFATPRFESLEREVKRSTGDSIPRTSTRSRYAPARAPVSRIRTMDDDDDGDDEREEEEGAEEKKEKILNHLFNSARHRYVGVAKDQGERMPM